jgi:hypothetical protein
MAGGKSIAERHDAHQRGAFQQPANLRVDAR